MQESNRIIDFYIHSDNGQMFSISAKENGNLTDYFDVQKALQSCTGKIYAARIGDHVKALDGSFMALNKDERGYCPGNKNLQGEWIMVTGVCDPIGDKVIRVSENVRFAGNYVIILHNSDTIAVSKKVRDREVKTSLRAYGESFVKIFKDKYGQDRKMGIILRSECENAQYEDIFEDFTCQFNKYIECLNAFEKAKIDGNPCTISNPDYLYNELNKYKLSEINKIYVDDVQIIDKINNILPKAKRLIEYGNLNVNEKYDISRETAKLFGRKVYLKSGAFLIIERTEAMTVIDVNSGCTTGIKDKEKLAFTVDMEAAVEVMRQIRLRNIGGIIIIDMIDLENEEDKAKILQEMRKISKNDPTPCDVWDITPLCIVEITRQKTQNIDVSP